MSFSLLVRSLLALLLGVAVVGLTVTYAGVPPTSALDAAINDQTESGPVVPTPPPEAPRPDVNVRHARSGPPVVPTPTPTPRPVVLSPKLKFAAFPDIAGHIFYTDPNHNIRFISGQYASRQFTGDGSSVAPALAPDGHELAWVTFKRNYSDIEITPLGFRRGGSVVAISTTVLTQDESPPPVLQTAPPPPGYQPSYEWWATEPSWLPDGRHLLYVSDRPGYDPSNQANVAMSVWQQGLTDPVTNAVRLSVPTPGTNGDDSPQWRPHDPTTFMYVNYGFADAQGQVGQGVIEAASALTGTAPTAPPIDLTPQGVLEYHPAWSPDGRLIAFIEDEGNRSDLRVMPFHVPGSLADYNRAITVARGAPYISQPFWSPDGRWLGYLTSSGGDFHMVIRRVKRHPLRFGPPISVVQAGPVSADYRPTWGP